MNKNDFGSAKDDPKIEINKPPEQPRSLWQRPDFNLFLYILFILVSLYVWRGMAENNPQHLAWSEFLDKLGNDQVSEVYVTEKYIIGTLKETDPRSGQPLRIITVPLKDSELNRLLEEHKVKVAVKPPGSDWLSNFLFNWVLPFGVLFLIWGWVIRRIGGGGPGAGFLNIGNKVRIYAEGDVKETFDDVAGQDEAKQELQEVIEFLKDPGRIQKIGARMPKGVLLVGPPGTGKTLLARAVAGEAGVPFFNISGSEFIEMFVGVGAARVRDLFEQARQKAPCIIFIDELDAIGRQRGGAMVMGGHDEREQTLNQLLTEMDGFDPSSGVVVMGATNRPEILDKALLRPGRFDRQIVVDKPDLEAREAILRLHTRKMRLAEDVDLHVVALRTPGMVGADLANIANEAAIMALRHGREVVAMEDFEQAIDRVIAGPEKKHRALGDEEKRRVAIHESGHTLVAKSVPTAEPVHKVSIIPRGVAALGYTLQLPVQEKFLSTEEELKDQIAILLGGRVAEEQGLGSISSGAANDLERASEIARGMITQLGMSRKLGPLTWGRRQQLQFLEGQGVTEERNYSEQTAEAIDAEVREIVEQQHQRVTEILTRRRAALDALAQRLLEKEVISGEEVDEVIAGAEGRGGSD
jgi:cell division protease FtsH